MGFLEYTIGPESCIGRYKECGCKGKRDLGLELSFAFSNCVVLGKSFNLNLNLPFCIILLYYCLIIFIVVWIQLPPFSPHHFPRPHPHLPPPALHPSPLCLCLWVLYIWSLMTLSLISPIVSLPAPLCYCQFVLYFNVSGYIFLACLFCWLGSTYRWDHINLNFLSVT